MQGIKVMMAWVMLGSTGWAARVSVGDTEFSLEVPDIAKMRKQESRQLVTKIGKVDSIGYSGKTEDGLHLYLLSFKNPYNRIANTFFVPITDGYYRGIISNIYSDGAAVKFDNQKILNQGNGRFYLYELIVDYPDGVEAYARAILSTKNDITVMVLLYADIFSLSYSIDLINEISNSLSWQNKR